MSGNGFQMSCGNEKTAGSTGSGDVDITTDPASSSIFAVDSKRFDDLKQMLDGNRDNLKLEAMKRIVGMVAKGKDASVLFPAVVKNVVSKNLEIKKLVYVYLTRYAEEQQDLALLSISTFQRALRDPNQLIRASALRVLSSIRVTVIAPIMMLAIKEAVMDMSPFVRKTAAHAIPKLHSLDPDMKDQLIDVLERLLGDKTTLVAGSAIQAFEEICPERVDLIHKKYRKLCHLLVDVEEWGQVVIINTLTRYARAHFVSPNNDDQEDMNGPFYESSDGEEGACGDGKGGTAVSASKARYIMDPDHRLLLRQAKPLLNSRNSAVVMAVAQLYHHCAPMVEVGIVCKSLIRLLRSHQNEVSWRLIFCPASILVEIQYVVLSNIATMAVKRKGMFEPFLKTFFVHTSDLLHIKVLKLEILTSLATETNISTVLREFQTYVVSSEKDFVAATIQAIGRCACSISEVTNICLNGLVRLMSNKDETVVAESVVVMKTLLQMKASDYHIIICHMARLVDKITVPMARASILWLIGEYSEHVPKIAPDVLRKLAKTFTAEEDIVKLQVLNLATKLCITNPKQTMLLSRYVFNLAKYDQNYDIRDRSRFLRQMVLPDENGGLFSKYAKKILLASKPAPLLASTFKDRDNFQLGTLSHVLNMRTYGYQELPSWPVVAPDPEVRNVDLPCTLNLTSSRSAKKRKDLVPFYSESESSDDETSDETSDEGSSEDVADDVVNAEPPGSDTGSASSNVNNSSVEEEETGTGVSEEEDDSSDDISSNSTGVDDTHTSKVHEFHQQSGGSGVDGIGPEGSQSPPCLLLDFDDMTEVGVPSATDYPLAADNLLTPTLVNNLGITSDSMQSNAPPTNKVQPGMEVQSFPEVASLSTGSSTDVLMAVDFNDTTQPADLQLCVGHEQFRVRIAAPVGELLRPYMMSEAEFIKQQCKLTGMHENTVSVTVGEVPSAEAVCACALTTGNLLQVPSTEEKIFRFAAKTLSAGAIVLVSVSTGHGRSVKVTVNCEKIVIGSMLTKDIQSAVSDSWLAGRL